MRASLAGAFCHLPASNEQDEARLFARSATRVERFTLQMRVRALWTCAARTKLVPPLQAKFESDQRLSRICAATRAKLAGKNAFFLNRDVPSSAALLEAAANQPRLGGRGEAKRFRPKLGATLALTTSHRRRLTRPSWLGFCATARTFDCPTRNGTNPGETLWQQNL